MKKESVVEILGEADPTSSNEVFVYLKIRVSIDDLPETREAIEQYASVEEAYMEKISPGLTRLNW